MIWLFNKLQDFLDLFRSFDFLASLSLRLYLAPIFWIAGMEKLKDFDSIVDWFGNPDWGLGLPMPYVMASLATGTEVIGAVLLIVGLATRWIAIPLAVTMVVAAYSVHWVNGWQANADVKGAFASQHLGPLQIEDATGAAERLQSANALLEQHGNISWLTEKGQFVVLNNGIEWAATYFIMLFALFFLGGGKYLSLDYFIKRRFRE